MYDLVTTLAYRKTYGRSVRIGMQSRWKVEILGHALGINMHSPATRSERKKICDAG
jgi:hypothetical protein